MSNEGLRRAIEAEIAEPGAVTKAELKQALAENPPDDPPPAPEGRFQDSRFDPARFD